jgi:hypothetical protein
LTCPSSGSKDKYQTISARVKLKSILWLPREAEGFTSLHVIWASVGAVDEFFAFAPRFAFEASAVVVVAAAVAMAAFGGRAAGSEAGDGEGGAGGRDGEDPGDAVRHALSFVGIPESVAGRMRPTL